MILYSRVQFMCIHAPYISIFIFLYPSYMSMLPWHSSGIWIFDSSRRSIPKSLSSDSVITVLGSQVRRLHISAQGSQYGCLISLMMFGETWEKLGKHRSTKHLSTSSPKKLTNQRFYILDVIRKRSSIQRVVFAHIFPGIVASLDLLGV